MKRAREEKNDENHDDRKRLNEINEDKISRIFGNRLADKMYTPKRNLVVKQDQLSIFSIANMQSPGLKLKNPPLTADKSDESSATSLILKLQNTQSSGILQIQDKSNDISSNKKTQHVKQLVNELKKTNEKNVIVYCDGACIKNGQPGAKAGVGIYFPNKEYVDISEKVPSNEKQTNQVAELYAAIRALEIVQSDFHLTIFTDSKYVIGCATEWKVKWKKNNWKKKGGEIKNLEIIKKLDRLLNGRIVEWNHVSGHSGIKGNEMADKLATDSIKY